MANIYKARASEEARIKELQRKILKIELAIKSKKELIENSNLKEDDEEDDKIKTKIKIYNYQRLIIHWQNLIKEHNDEINDLMMEIRSRW